MGASVAEGRGARQFLDMPPGIFLLPPRMRPTTVCPRQIGGVTHNPGTMANAPLPHNEINTLVEGLNRLACNLWSTWDQDTLEIFQFLSPRAWQNLYHNPVAVLHEVSPAELRVR